MPPSYLSSKFRGFHPLLSLQVPDSKSSGAEKRGCVKSRQAQRWTSDHTAATWPQARPSDARSSLVLKEKENKTMKLPAADVYSSWDEVMLQKWKPGFCESYISSLYLPGLTHPHRLCADSPPNLFFFSAFIINTEHMQYLLTK